MNYFHSVHVLYELDHKTFCTPPPHNHDPAHPYDLLYRGQSLSSQGGWTTCHCVSVEKYS